MNNLIPPQLLSAIPQHPQQALVTHTTYMTFAQIGCGLVDGKAYDPFEFDEFVHTHHITDKEGFANTANRIAHIVVNELTNRLGSEALQDIYKTKRANIAKAVEMLITSDVLMTIAL